MSNAPVKSKPHLQQVDYIRAIAAIAVALFHLGGSALPVLKYGWLGVNMFFLLSGFIICWSIPQNYGLKFSWRFISKRIIRIEPPYIISIALSIIVNYILINHYKPDWFNILCHFAYINNFLNKPYLNPVYWTLGIEFQFYLFIALCFPIIKSRLGAWLLPVFCTAPWFLTISGSALPAVFPVFALGILYYLYISKITRQAETILIGIIIAVFLLIQSGWMPFAVTLFSLLLLTLPLKSNRFISFFSKISFSLYLTHTTIGGNIVAFMGLYLPKTYFFKGVEFLTGIAVSILAAWLFYLCAERPFLKLSKRLSY